MAYASNILPSEEAYYKLHNASITNGIMHILPGGYAEYTITTPVLAALTDYFRVSILLTEAISRYTPTVYAYIHAITKAGKEYYYSLTPTSDQDKIYTQEIALEAAEYSEFTFKLHATEDTYITLWELCPEAADSNVEVEIAGVKQSLPRLLYDYNTEPLQVDIEERVVGLITFNLLGATDLQGHLEISYVSSSDCVLTIRVKDTGTEELYTPILYDIKAGRGNIALPHSYLKRLATLHTTYVTAQVSAGTLTIGTRGLLYTIDGGYLADRTLDAGIEVFDFTVEQPEGYATPTALWVVGIDANDCLVKSREYDADTSVGFTPRYSLGYAKTAAIEFNGNWKPDADYESAKYTIVTDEDPFVFWTDASDKLYCQRGEDQTTRFLVDTNVSMVSACRGFNSMIEQEQDQGLVVLYVKNGVATYRNYCRLATGAYVWQGPFTIDIENETVLNAYVHRLNDYRLSFVITTPYNNYWYITDRTYVTQAAPIETFRASYDAPYQSLAVFPASFTYDSLVATGQLSEDYKTIKLTFNYPIKAQGPINNELFTVSASNIESISITGEKELSIKLFDEALLGVTVTYRDVDVNLLFSPLEDRWIPMTALTVIVPGYNYKDTIGVTYSSVTASVSQRGIETIRNAASDTVSVTYSSPSASIISRAVSTKKNSAEDTFSVNYASASSTIVLTQTGVKPI